MFTLVVMLVQSASPESGIGEAGIFALAAAAEGAVAMLIARSIHAPLQKRRGTAGKPADA